jgi:hypothetical protein
MVLSAEGLSEQGVRANSNIDGGEQLLKMAKIRAKGWGVVIKFRLHSSRVSSLSRERSYGASSFLNNRGAPGNPTDECESLAMNRSSNLWARHRCSSRSEGVVGPSLNIRDAPLSCALRR